MSAILERLRPRGGEAAGSGAAAAGPLAPLRRAWAGLAPRERRAVLLAGLVLGAFLAWVVAIAPAWRTVRSAPAELDRLDAQLQQMQRQAADVQTLRQAAPVSASQAITALRAATDRLGATAKLATVGDRATLNFTELDGAQLRDWLAEARSGARARPVEAQLTRGPKGYSGSVVLSLGSAGVGS